MRLIPADVFISIHALRKESDTGSVTVTDETFEFQSTLSVRRATLSASGQSPHVHISIHALRKESDVF